MYNVQLKFLLLIQSQVRLHVENIELQAKLKEKEKEIETLRKLVSMQMPAAQERKALQQDDGEKEERGYDHQRVVSGLVEELTKLRPLVKEVESLKRQLKHADEVNLQAKDLDEQLVKQVTISSEKDAEISRLNRIIAEQGSSREAGLVGQLATKDLEVSRLKAQLAKKDQLAAVGARSSDELDAQDRPRLCSDPDSPHAVTIAALQAEYDERVKKKDLLIARLKERVNKLTENTVTKEHTQPDEVTKLKQKLTGRKLAGVSVGDVGGVTRADDMVDERLEEAGDRTVVCELQKALREKDEKLRSVMTQLGSLERVAGNVVKMEKHTKEQSGLIVQLKRELEATKSGVSVTCGEKV